MNKLLMLIQVCLICRKSYSASPTSAYESPRVHIYSNEHFYDGLNDNNVYIATQQHNLANENYINSDLRS